MTDHSNKILNIILCALEFYFCLNTGKKKKKKSMGHTDVMTDMFFYYQEQKL